MAEAHLAAKFNKPGFDIVDHYTYALHGDGCLTEVLQVVHCHVVARKVQETIK